MSNNTYTAWIPTNSGSLSQEYVLSQNCYEKVACGEHEKKYRFATQNTLSFSDTIIKDIEEQELGFYFIFTIDFSEEDWAFELSASPGDDQNTELCRAEGTIESTGKITFGLNIGSCCSVCAPDRDCHASQAVIGDNLPNTIFTFIKRQIHTDLHHNEKVDNVVPVVANESEWKDATQNALVAKIKSIEFDAKRIFKDQLPYVKYKKIQELMRDAEGFFAYLKAFSHTFDPDNEACIKKASFVLDSLRAINGKVLSEKQRRDQYGSIFATSIALFVSLNIMIKNSFFHIAKSDLRYALLVFFIVAIFAMSLDIIYFGNRSLAFFQPIEKAREYYQRVYLSAIKRENFKKLRFKHKLMYLFLRYGFIFFAIVGGWASIKFLLYFF